jgi:hypothetical protein
MNTLNFELRKSHGVYKYVVYWNRGAAQRLNVIKWATECGIACSVIEYNRLLLFYTHDLSAAEWFIMTWS